MTVVSVILSVLVGTVARATPVHAASASNADSFTAYAMAPLTLPTDPGGWASLDRQLQAAKDQGLDGVAADVWWGSVEGKARGVFDWSGYDELFTHIVAHGLRVAPNLSFHQCGGNVGDDCNIPIPAWVWSQFDGTSIGNVTVNADALKFESEQGNTSQEYVQGWADSLVVQDYSDFAQAFARHFGCRYAGSVGEISVPWARQANSATRPTTAKIKAPGGRTGAHFRDTRASRNKTFRTQSFPNMDPSTA